MRFLAPLALVFLLTGCDTLGGDRGGLLGTWALAGATTAQNAEVDAPVGSTIRFERNGFFGLSSVNGCGGEYVVRGERFWVSEAACTLIGAAPEADLAQFMFQGGDSFGYSFNASGDLLVAVSSREAFLRLRFERE